MFNIGFSELVILAVLGLLVLGPDQLPAMARKLARMINELKRATEDVFSPVEEMKKQAFEIADKARKQAHSISEEVLRPHPNPEHKHESELKNDSGDGSDERG